MSKLVAAVLKVKVYKGNSRDLAGADEVIGSLDIPLSAVSCGKSIEGLYPLTPPPAEDAVPEVSPTAEAIDVANGASPGDDAYCINVSIIPDDDIQGYGNGGRLISISSCQLSPLPPSWTPAGDEFKNGPVAVDGSEEKTMPPEVETHTCAFEIILPVGEQAGIELPPATVAEDGEEGKDAEGAPAVETPAKPRLLMLPLAGKLEWLANEVSNSQEGGGNAELVATPDPVSEGGESTPAEEKATEPTGQWIMRWATVNSHRLFMHKSSVALVREQLEFAEVALEGTLRHSNGWECAVSIDAGGLLAADAVVANNCVGTTTPKPVDDAGGDAESDPEATEALVAKREQVAKMTEELDAMETKCVASLSIALSSALIVSAIAASPDPSLIVSSVITQRDPLPRHPPKDAVRDLKDEISKVAELVSEEFYELFLGPDAEVDADELKILSPDERRKALLLSLNTSGQYNAFKKSLQRVVSQVIAEKFPQAPEKNTPEAEKFYSDLYAFLIAEVNISLNKMFKSYLEKEGVVQKTNAPDVKAEELLRLLELAGEAESADNKDRAMLLHEDRVTKSDAQAKAEFPGAFNAEPWFEFASFCFRNSEAENGGECLKEALSIDPNHVASLQNYASVIMEDHSESPQSEGFQSALGFLKSALQTELAANGQPHGSLRTHALLALYHKRSGVDLKDKVCNAELKVALKAATFEAEGREEANAVTTRASVWLNIAEHCASIRQLASCTFAVTLAEEDEKKRTGNMSSTTIRLKSKILGSQVNLYQGDTDAALSAALEAVESDPESGAAHLAVANAYFSTAGASAPSSSLNAKKSYTLAKAAMIEEGSDVSVQLYLRLGNLYLQAGDFELAKGTFLEGCSRYARCSSLWLGVGIASLRLEQMADSEDALSEANILDNRNAEVWGYLALLCLSVPTPRLVEAAQCVDQSVRCGLTSASLLRELGNAYMAADQLQTAESLLRRALASVDSGNTRKRLADVLAAQNCAEAALTEYEIILQANDSDVKTRAEVLQKCCQLLKSLGRNAEAADFNKQLGLLKGP
jgi:Tfp pilus assembly protein PilF